MRHCRECNSEREGDICWKCGYPTFLPHKSWKYPSLPPVDRIRDLAREVGYAVAIHGSQERDLDLIAAPWTAGAVCHLDLVTHIAKGLPARVVDVERKPLGRYAYNLQMDGWYKIVDLSVCPLPDEPPVTQRHIPYLENEAACVAEIMLKLVKDQIHGTQYLSMVLHRIRLGALKEVVDLTLSALQQTGDSPQWNDGYCSALSAVRSSARSLMGREIPGEGE